MSSVPTLVAVVDDEAPVRTMLRRALRLADYDVELYASGEAFLAALPARMPACAIVDIHMPGVDGLEVERRLRQARWRIPTVMITASDDASLDGAAAAAGASCLLRKPFSTDTLLAAVHDAIAQASTARES